MDTGTPEMVLTIHAWAPHLVSCIGHFFYFSWRAWQPRWHLQFREKAMNKYDERSISLKNSPVNKQNKKTTTSFFFILFG